jgi:hypothetical protein
MKFGLNSQKSYYHQYVYASGRLCLLSKSTALGNITVWTACATKAECMIDGQSEQRGLGMNHLHGHDCPTLVRRGLGRLASVAKVRQA